VSRKYPRRRGHAAVGPRDHHRVLRALGLVTKCRSGSRRGVEIGNGSGPLIRRDGVPRDQGAQRCARRGGRRAVV